MKANQNKKPRTIRTVNENDQVIETTEGGLPGTITPQDIDVEDELRGMQGYREYVRSYRDEDGGGHGLNFGDF